MNSEQQYIELYEQARGMIFQHSSEVMNAMRDAAFEQFRSLGFPSRKVERYKYTDMQALFAPDYGLNLNRLEIPVNPYDAFRCDVPNLSTMLYFVVNDAFYSKVLPKGNIPEGVVIGSLKELATSQYYHRLASKDEDAVTSLNTMLAQDGLYICTQRCRPRSCHSDYKYSPFGCRLNGQPTCADYRGGGSRSQVLVL